MKSLETPWVRAKWPLCEHGQCATRDRYGTYLSQWLQTLGSSGLRLPTLVVNPRTTVSRMTARGPLQPSILEPEGRGGKGVKELGEFRG